MTKTGDQKRKINGADASGRPAKKASDGTQNSNAGTPSVGFSGEAIPAPVWGRAMDFLPYTDVLTCLSVNRMLSFEAPKYVKRIIVLKSCEVEYLPLVRNRRRFENVTLVKILCLVVPLQEETDTERHILCTDVIDKIVPFLEVFPKLGKCRLGGIEQAKDLTRYLLEYNPEFCAGPDDHASHFRRLIKHFAVAFERGSLPQHLLLGGVVEGLHVQLAVCMKDDDGTNCSSCSQILRAFPLNNLLQMHHLWGASCYSNRDIEKRIKQRNWSRQCLVSASWRYTAEEVIELVRVPVGQSYKKSLEEMGAKHPSHLYYLPKFKAGRLLLMLNLGIKMSMRDDRKRTTKKPEFLSALLDDGDNKGGYALAKSTFDLLVQAGYPFEENDFVLLDDTTDPELKDLILNDENTFGEILPIGHDAEWS